MFSDFSPQLQCYWKNGNLWFSHTVAPGAAVLKKTTKYWETWELATLGELWREKVTEQLKGRISRWDCTGEWMTPREQQRQIKKASRGSRCGWGSRWIPGHRAKSWTLSKNRIFNLILQWTESWWMWWVLGWPVLSSSREEEIATAETQNHKN